MNRPYKMPAVVGGRRAQKREVFSIIHLLQSFVLCCGKQHWQPASFDPTKYDVPGPEQFPAIRNCQSWNWLKIIRCKWTKERKIPVFLTWLWRGARMVERRRWKMNPEAFMLLDRLEKLMCSPQSQHPSDPFLGPVASMSRGWKGILLKFGGEVGEGRVHLEDTFSVPLDSSSLEGRPLQPLWPDPLSKRVPSVCALLSPPWPRHSLWIFLRCAHIEACGGASLNVLLPLLLWATQYSAQLWDNPLHGLQKNCTTSGQAASLELKATF